MPTAIVRAIAHDDMRRIFTHIAPQNLRAAMRVINAVEHAIEFLADNPMAGASCQSTLPGAEDCRFWPLRKYTSYLVIYRPIREGIDVIRVIHGAFDMGRILGRIQESDT